MLCVYELLNTLIYTNLYALNTFNEVNSEYLLDICI